MIQYKESKFVDDMEEVRAMIAEQKILDPKVLEEKLFPRLQELIDKSNGRLKNFYIWP